MKDRSSLVRRAAGELEAIRSIPLHVDGALFPAACRKLLTELPGNDRCMDCGSPDPEWASVSFGTLICMQCSGKHRSYGVQTSFVRSVRMDTWTHSQILAMLEGGNDQLQGFFNRHRLGNSSTMSSKRYHTKAANFYRSNLAKHVDSVSQLGAYEGREASRRAAQRSTPKRQKCGVREATEIQKHPSSVSQQTVAVQ